MFSVTKSRGIRVGFPDKGEEDRESSSPDGTTGGAPGPFRRLWWRVAGAAGAPLRRCHLLFLVCLPAFLPVWACRDDDPTGVSAGPAPTPSEFRDWDAWLELNARSLSSLDSEDFSDLQFLKAVIGDARLVQLGESGHGVAEFDRVKVRLIKFLHQEMGFDVIAFESSIYECFQADRGADTLSAEKLMTTCIYPVWHTREVVPPWIRSSVPVRQWGTSYLLMVPRDQYDGILFIETVSPPNYVTAIR